MHHFSSDPLTNSRRVSCTNIYCKHPEWTRMYHSCRNYTFAIRLCQVAPSGSHRLLEMTSLIALQYRVVNELFSDKLWGVHLQFVR